MIEIRKRVSDSQVRDVIRYCQEHVYPHLTPDVSNFAQGRQRVWLQHECPLNLESQQFKPGLKVPRLWDWIREHCKRAGMQAEPDFALVYHGPVGIGWHGDAAYAAPESVFINLGRADYCYNPNRKFVKPAEAERICEVHQLSGGEVGLVDCKHQHRSYPTEHRTGLAIWSCSHKAQPKFNQYLQHTGQYVPL